MISKKNCLNIMAFGCGFITVFHLNCVINPIISIAFVLILAFLLIIFEHGKIRIKEISSYLKWYGMFTALVFFSLLYTPNSINPEFVIRRVAIIFVIGLISVAIVNNKERYKILCCGLAQGAVFLSVLSILLEGIAFGGGIRVGTETVGSAVLLSEIALYGFITEFYLFLEEKKKIYFIEAAFLLVVGFLTASRRGPVLCVATAMMMILFDTNIKKSKRIRYLLIALVSSLVVILYLLESGLFIQIVGDRFTTLLSVMNGSGIDESLMVRHSMKSYAMQLFFEKPILGYGAHGFAYMYYSNGELLLYSHNGFTEILSCYGLIGFALFYLPFIKLIRPIISMLNNKSSLLTNCILITAVISIFSEWFSIMFLSPMAVVLIGCGSKLILSRRL